MLLLGCMTMNSASFRADSILLCWECCIVHQALRHRIIMPLVPVSFFLRWCLPPFISPSRHGTQTGDSLLLLLLLCCLMSSDVG